MSDQMRTPPEEPDAPPTPEEIAAAEALRDALADPSRKNEAAEFARALSLSHEPRAIDAKEHARIVETAVARGEARKAERKATRRAVVVRVSFGAAGVVAMAAALALLVGPLDGRSPSAAMAPSAMEAVTPLVQARSTQPLFHEPFARGGQSARIDRIATARAADLRDNRFAAWGVR